MQAPRRGTLGESWVDFAQLEAALLAEVADTLGAMSDSFQYSLMLLYHVPVPLAHLQDAVYPGETPRATASVPQLGLC
jgi:hypothetical protein